ncbi:hypothetical protein Tco_0948043 [Tanacetum coccineum]
MSPSFLRHPKCDSRIEGHGYHRFMGQCMLMWSRHMLMTVAHACVAEQMCHRHYATYEVASAGMGIASDIRDSQFSDDFVSVFSLGN